MIIELNENAGVKNIKKLYLELKEKIDNEPEIVIDMKKIKKVDLSLAQLLFAFSNEMKTRGKKMALKSVSTEIRNQLFLSGFLKNRKSSGQVKKL